MKCYRDLASAVEETSPTRRRAAAIGFFDGLHVGHQGLLRELGAWARELEAEPAVVTFDRHPQEVFTGAGPIRILSLEHRLLLLARHGISAALVLHFDLELAALTAEEFVRRVLVEGLRASALLMGFDSAFGQGRKGTFERLLPRAGSLGIALRRAGVEILDGERVSSTLVREAVLAGNLHHLERLLGRRFSLLGRVRTGDGRGRTIGFPTANLDVLGSALPPRGVYFAQVELLGNSFEEILDRARPAEPRPGLTAVVNVGMRPTFKDPAAGAVETVEAHILDWSGSLLGDHLEVSFLKRHRDEMKFPSAAALVEQIRADIEACRSFVATSAC